MAMTSVGNSCTLFSSDPWDAFTSLTSRHSYLKFLVTGEAKNEREIQNDISEDKFAQEMVELDSTLAELGNVFSYDRRTIGQNTSSIQFKRPHRTQHEDCFS